MLTARTAPADKRRNFREALRGGRLLRLPGAVSALVALAVQRQGFEGVYVSGAALSADLGLPDIGLTTLGEVSQRAHEIARTVELPTLVDVDTGFGEPLNTARTVAQLEGLGIAGCHIEDQVNPKRCGHLSGKQVVPRADAERRLRAAAEAKRDPNFLVMARTDTAAVEGLESAAERAKAYIDAGAEAIFAEAMGGPQDIAYMRQATAAPLLINMTEFGKSELLTTAQLRDLGVDMVIYPVTTLRLAMKAVEEGLAELDAAGTQAGLLDRMQTRGELYERLDYAAYAQFDEAVAGYTDSE